MFPLKIFHPNIVSLIIPVFLLCAMSCTKRVSSHPDPVPVDTTTLKSVAPFKVGAAIDVSLCQNDIAYRSILVKEHNSITTENALKWPTVHPAESKFDFSGGDYIAAFCVANKKRMHGHCLVWYTANPDWLNQFSGDSLAWESLFKTHIQTVVAHYKGKATGWDVVNEAFHDGDGSLRVDDMDATDNFDDGSIWARHLGRDYIARAFIYAHEADPDALLFYNDYGQEWGTRKTDSIIAMVSDFKKRGIPISGLGMQMHTDINASADGITVALQKLAATGLSVHISELDIGVNPSNDPSAIFTNARSQQQADKFGFIVHQYRQLVPTAQRYGITTWNVTDKDSWIVTYLNHKDWPLLFDNTYQRKAAYYSFRSALVN